MSFCCLVGSAIFRNFLLKKLTIKAEHARDKLDALVRRILHELDRDCGLSNSQLADRVGLSAALAGSAQRGWRTRATTQFWNSRFGRVINSNQQ
jgi:Winged helix-turn-helix DNA-binding